MTPVRTVQTALAAAFLWLLTSPEVALACTVCGATKEETRGAFVFTTGFLTSLPLLLLGAIGWYVRKRVFEIEDLEEAERLHRPAE